MGKILTIAVTGVSGMFCCSCNSTGCTDNQNSLPLAGFYAYDTEKSITVKGLEIGGVDAPNDSLLYTSGLSLSEIYMPFRANRDNTAYYFHYTQEGLDDPAMNDTIAFTYTSQPFFASEDCGAMYRYRITSMSYTTHIIDSVAITDSLITNVNTQRIKIFLRTVTE